MKTHWIVPLLFSALTLSAQTAARHAYAGQAWVGLLVADSCETGARSAANKSKSSRESDLTVNGRTTTPAVDDAGTRGSSSTLDDARRAPGEKQMKPETGDILAPSTSSTDPGWEPARKQARSLRPSCALDPHANRFALLLPDGTLLHFDTLANEAITTQFSALPPAATNPKYYRVSVQGKLQNGKIALDSIHF